MADQEVETLKPVVPSPGDVIAIETEKGMRHVQVTHHCSPYPDIVRAVHPVFRAGPAEDIAKGKTAFTAMVELSGALQDKAARTKLIGRASVPSECREFPTFRLPIRNRDGEVVYWWAWDGEELRILPDAADEELPIREVVPIDALRMRLAELG
ncbi:hypothetical protein [Microbaculum sp. FT89]|uniref:hypothetical protein n=1 Tax=Microbaculum sp. FT89 TaxID=3447298 RepID=UPI003F52BD29